MSDSSNTHANGSAATTSVDDDFTITPENYTTKVGRIVLPPRFIPGADASKPSGMFVQIENSKGKRGDMSVIAHVRCKYGISEKKGDPENPGRKVGYVLQAQLRDNEDTPVHEMYEAIYQKVLQEIQKNSTALYGKDYSIDMLQEKIQSPIGFPESQASKDKYGPRLSYEVYEDNKRLFKEWKKCTFNDLFNREEKTGKDGKYTVSSKLKLWKLPKTSGLKSISSQLNMDPVEENEDAFIKYAEKTGLKRKAEDVEQNESAVESQPSELVAKKVRAERSETAERGETQTETNPQHQAFLESNLEQNIVEDRSAKRIRHEESDYVPSQVTETVV